MSSPRKQKQLGPAPIASFEDSSSDELKFKMDLNKTDTHLTDIVEQDSPKKKVEAMTESINSDNSGIASGSGSNSIPSPPVSKLSGLRVSQTPRIDISRASSSSQHEDSRDSSPENVFEQVGTGTLQEVAADIGFVEDGTQDLRSSMGELHYVEGEKEKEKSEREKDLLPNRVSPILSKFDEQQQACLQQNARKDSVSSEVAALLCISGRSSRISSVGSQGSAVSRLSAISGVSRSPSPHKMLLVTSFCGPKPINNGLASCGASAIDSITSSELEQVILARKHDVTKAIFAEGIDVDTSTPKKIRAQPKREANGGVKEPSLEKNNKKTVTGLHVTSVAAAAVSRNNAQAKKGGVLKKNNRTVVGMTPEGTQYIRIKLKPDHLYKDKGVSANEHIIEESEIAKKPPDSLSLSRDVTNKKAAPHFTQLVQADSAAAAKRSDHHLTPNASPKPSRHSILRAAGSRSPSPATVSVSVSRKSSFCSLFKSKEAAISPESPTIGEQRKKSAISILLDSPRDRSRSKSRESDRSGGGPSANSTPSKQRSVLAIFKPKRNTSKSSSPIDSEIMLASSVKPNDQQHRSRKQTQRQNDSHQGSRSTTPKLRYYDTPTDGSTIYIPLHTPPEEKENVSFASCVLTSQPMPIATTHHVQVCEKTSIASTSVTSPAIQKEQVRSQALETDAKPSLTKTIVSTSTTPTAKPQPTTAKTYRIELPDGSILIPLRSPSDEHTDDVDADNSQQWSTAVQRNSSQESQDTVISSQAPSLVSVDAITKNGQSCLASKMVTVPKPPTPPISTACEINSEKTSKQSSQDESIVFANATVVTTSTIAETAGNATRTMTKERKRILFSTKIGSGSEEQIFATQLSLSKTESLSSQLSEQVSNLESPPVEKDNDSNRTEHLPQSVKMRFKEDVSVREADSCRDSQKSVVKSDVINVNRHSMYIENIDEIMENQKRIDIERKNSIMNDRKMAKSTVANEMEMEKPNGAEIVCLPGTSKSADSTEERRNVQGSSGSDHESEIDLKSEHRSPRQIGAVEEESTGLVAQDSYDDELPYVPTTLPEERSLGIALIPIRDRALMDVKTCPLERPRSTTPLNPSCLEEYCGAVVFGSDDIDNFSRRGEKLRISLPRKDSRDASAGGGQRSRSPRRTSNASGKSWFEFAEQGIGCQTTTNTVCSPSNSYGSFGSERRESHPDEFVTLSAQQTSQKPQNTTEWIDFENIPEKRKPAKRITTLPQKDSMIGDALHHVQYNYVNPDECQCECHGNERDAGSNNTDSERKESLIEDQSPDDCVPLLESDPEEAGNRNSQIETAYDAIVFGACNEPSVSHGKAESLKHQCFSTESFDSNQAKRKSIDSAGSQSPVYARSSKTTTVQLPQRLQR